MTGGFDTVQRKAPFLSDPIRTHWLTNGYYFWRGQSCAMKWGFDSYSANGNFATLKAKLQLEEDELLDLVSNTEHIEYFEKMLSKFMNHMRQSMGSTVTPTVSGCIQYFRNKSKKHPEVFPFLAIMAAEESRYKKYKFVENKTNEIALNKRVQLCLFEGNENRIKDKQLIYPDKDKWGV